MAEKTKRYDMETHRIVPLLPERVTSANIKQIFRARKAELLKKIDDANNDKEIILYAGRLAELNRIGEIIFNVKKER